MAGAAPAAMARRAPNAEARYCWHGYGARLELRRSRCRDPLSALAADRWAIDRTCARHVSCRGEPRSRRVGATSLRPAELARFPLIEAEWPPTAVNAPNWLTWQKAASRAVKDRPRSRLANCGEFSRGASRHRGSHCRPWHCDMHRRPDQRRTRKRHTEARLINIAAGLRLLHRASAGSPEGGLDRRLRAMGKGCGLRQQSGPQAAARWSFSRGNASRLWTKGIDGNRRRRTASRISAFETLVPGQVLSVCGTSRWKSSASAGSRKRR